MRGRVFYFITLLLKTVRCLKIISFCSTSVADTGHFGPDPDPVSNLRLIPDPDQPPDPAYKDEGKNIRKHLQENHTEQSWIY